jgi:hypothetical protein
MNRTLFHHNDYKKELTQVKKLSPYVIPNNRSASCDDQGDEFASRNMRPGCSIVGSLDHRIVFNQRHSVIVSSDADMLIRHRDVLVVTKSSRDSHRTKRHNDSAPVVRHGSFKKINLHKALKSSVTKMKRMMEPILLRETTIVKNRVQLWLQMKKQLLRQQVNSRRQPHVANPSPLVTPTSIFDPMADSHKTDGTLPPFSGRFNSVTTVENHCQIDKKREKMMTMIINLERSRRSIVVAQAIRMKRMSSTWQQWHRLNNMLLQEILLPENNP